MNVKFIYLRRGESYYIPILLGLNRIFKRLYISIKNTDSVSLCDHYNDDRIR